MNVSEISDHITLYKPDDRDIPPSGHAVIAFGGINQGLGIPVFEFFNTLTSIGADTLFIRDPSQSWYQNAIPGLGDNCIDTAETIRTQSNTLFPDRKIVTLGNSMGGYAAMLFSYLCGFGKALAFAPQTFITPALREQYGDLRWKKQLEEIKHIADGDLEFLTKAPHPPEIRIYAGREEELDALHARRLAGTRNIAINLIEGSGHNISRFLRESGQLEAIIKESLA